MDTLLRAVLVALAARALLDLWLEGDLFSPWRSNLEEWRTLWRSGAKAPRLRLMGFLGKLLTCRFCLGYHVTLWLALLSSWIAAAPQELPFLWLAAVALDHLAERVTAVTKSGD